MKKQIYTIKIEEESIEKSFYTSDIEKTMEEYLRNRNFTKWEIIDVNDMDNIEAFDKKNI